MTKSCFFLNKNFWISFLRSFASFAEARRIRFEMIQNSPEEKLPQSKSVFQRIWKKWETRWDQKNAKIKAIKKNSQRCNNKVLLLEVCLEFNLETS